jgi:hypothetical protein
MKHEKRVLAFVATLLLLTAGTSFAAHPLFSDDAGTLGKGTVQVELNGDIGTDIESGEGHTTKFKSSQIASTAGFGVTDKIDVVFGYTRPWGDGDVDGTSFKDNGSSDFSLSMKWQVCEHEGFSIAIKPLIGYSYALGAPEDDHTMSYGTTLILSKELEPFAFHLNVGYTYNDYNLAAVRDAGKSSVWNFSLAATFDVIKEKLKAVVDFGAATNEDKNVSEMPVFGLAGLIYLVNKNIDLSAGVKVGLTRPETDLTGAFGVTLKF